MPRTRPPSLPRLPAPSPPGGRLIVIDLAHHDRSALSDRLAHRWPGFSGAEMHALLHAAGLDAPDPTTVPGPIPVHLWSATTAQPAETASLLLATGH